MQFIDLGEQQKRIKQDLDERIQKVLTHGNYIMGPEIAELEQRLGDYVGCRHAIGCASGTDALLMALMAFGVGPGDAILTTPFTFIATAEVIHLLGARPVFVDIDENTFNIDPDKLEAAIDCWQSGTFRPKGVIAVDLFGLPADYDRINAIAKKHGLFVIEDAAQSFGAEYKGRKSGVLADIACTSFFPAKPLGCYGDGGMCFTDNDQLAGLLESIRVHGKGGHKYDNERIGINGRLDTLQAAILLSKFSLFPDEVIKRQDVARFYNEGLAGSGLQTPKVPDGYLSVWAQYSLLCASAEERGQIQNKLKQAGIPTAVYYPKPLHQQTAFAPLGYQAGDFPISQDYAQRIFSLPMHPYLAKNDQQRIIEVLLK